MHDTDLSSPTSITHKPQCTSPDDAICTKGTFTSWVLQCTHLIMSLSLASGIGGSVVLVLTTLCPPSLAFLFTCPSSSPSLEPTVTDAPMVSNCVSAAPPSEPLAMLPRANKLTHKSLGWSWFCANSNGSRLHMHSWCFTLCPLHVCP